MAARAFAAGGTRVAFLPAHVITVAETNIVPTTVVGLTLATYLVVQAKFVYGSGGTNVNCYVQTSIDLGVTWIDIMQFQFLTATLTKVSAVVSTTALAAIVAPTDGSLTINTIVSGLFGDRFRLKYSSTGTYATSTTLTIDGQIKG